MKRLIRIIINVLVQLFIIVPYFSNVAFSSGINNPFLALLYILFSLPILLHALIEVILYFIKKENKIDFIFYLTEGILILYFTQAYFLNKESIDSDYLKHLLLFSLSTSILFVTSSLIFNFINRYSGDKKFR